jgi:pyruvate formate lyase activating enzyme
MFAWHTASWTWEDRRICEGDEKEHGGREPGVVPHWWAATAAARTTATWCASCARAPAACAKASAASASCALSRRPARARQLWPLDRPLCIDPIEKKPLFHFLPGTPVLSFGTAGCNLTCKFCQNWETSRARDWQRMRRCGHPDTIAQTAPCAGLPQRGHDVQRSGGLLRIRRRCCRRLPPRGRSHRGGHRRLYCRAARAEFFRHFDAANIDLKGFSERFYRDLCSADLKTVLDTLVYVRASTQFGSKSQPCSFPAKTTATPNWTP